MSSITVQQLRVFQSILRTGTMSDAARELNRTQPAISASLKALEDQLDIELFTKVGSRLKPTAEARFLMDRAALILSELDETTSTLVRLKRELHGELKVVCLPSASQVLIPNLLTRFLSERPGVKLSFMTRASDTIQNWVASQQFDIGLSETPLSESELFCRYDVKLPCLLACHKDSIFSSCEFISLEMLGRESFIGLIPSHQITRSLSEKLRAEGLSLKQSIELQTTIPAFTFIEAGLGYSVIDPLSAESYRLINRSGNVIFRELPFELNYSLSILTPRYRDQSILANGLYDALVNELEKIKKQHTTSNCIPFSYL